MVSFVWAFLTVVLMVSGAATWWTGLNRDTSFNIIQRAAFVVIGALMVAAGAMCLTQVQIGSFKFTK